jgi:hypothetical protein
MNRAIEIERQPSNILEVRPVPAALLLIDHLLYVFRAAPVFVVDIYYNYYDGQEPSRTMSVVRLIGFIQ